jgi:hypothetical protein
MKRVILLLLSTLLSWAFAHAQEKGAMPEPLATVPIELTRDVIFVTASIGNSGPLQMALDSGSHTTLDESVANKLGLDLSMKALSTGIKGKQEISVIKDLTLRFARSEVLEPIVFAYSLEFLSKKIGNRVDGIIGVELFRKYVVEIDYSARQVRLWPAASFSYSGRGESVPVVYDQRLPLVAGTVTPFGKPPIPTRFQLDSGGSGTNVVFWSAFYQKHDLLSGTHDISELQQTEFGGTHTVKRGRVQAITVGAITVPEPDVRFSEREMGNLDSYGGNLGSGFFRRYKPIFDLPHDRVIFEKQP